MSDAPLVLIVGRGSTRRQEVAQTLIDRGRTVVICNGPPECPLIRDERCVVVGAADATILLEQDSPSREVAVAFDLCSKESRRCVMGGHDADARDLADLVDAALANQ